MVRLNRIYTRTGDDGTTGLGNGKRCPKHHLRVEAFGTVDEANAALGVARLHVADMPELDARLAAIQNDLFDLGADLCLPDSGEPPAYAPLRMIQAQVERLERDIDRLNADLAPLTSFILPAGSAASAHLHLARTVVRRAERCMTALAVQEPITPAALIYINRLSDFLFVAARWMNRATGDVLWAPGATRI
jgi:cob(I)alamin adenosyltransferase